MIVQHPRERRHPFNTVRLLERCLTRVAVRVDHDGCLRRGAEPLPLLPGAVLLYPGPDARCVSTLAERPSQLVVIDGTWHQAHTLYRDLPELHALPRVTLPANAQSEFSIRRQPQRHCLSTLEAVQLCLSALEPGTDGYDALRGAFRTMVTRQLGAMQRKGRTKKQRRRHPGLPRALDEDFGRLVVAYAETAPGAARRRLVAVTAARLSSGERFDFVIGDAGVAPGHLAHMGMRPEDLEGGGTGDEFRAAWGRFLEPEDILAVWTETTLDALRGMKALPARSVVLKAAYRRLADGSGGMDAIARREGLSGAPRCGPRRHQRLANAVAVAQRLHERAQSKNDKPRLEIG